MKLCNQHEDQHVYFLSDLPPKKSGIWDCCLCHVPFGSLFNSFLVHHFLWTTCPPTSIPHMFKFSMSHVWILTGSHVFVYMQTSTTKKIWTTNLCCSSQNIRCPRRLAGIGLDFSRQTLFQIWVEHYISILNDLKCHLRDGCGFVLFVLDIQNALRDYRNFFKFLGCH